MDNVFIESFNVGFRDDFLNVHYVLSLNDEPEKIE